MFSLVSYFILLLMVLISVAFFTLMERKVLGYIHLRKGPNKVGFVGVLQPFSDVIKLFNKEANMMKYMNLLMFMFIPFFALLLMLLFWIVYAWKVNQIDMEFSLIYILCLSSLGVYVILIGGWASNSKYALLGAFRGLAQVISYEVSLSMILMSVVMFCGSYSFYKLLVFQGLMWMIWGMFGLFLMWMISCLAETNRSPFDLSEGESELVSGFNVEYGGYGFAILFMSEYGNIIFMSMLSSVLFLGGLGWLCIKLLMVMYLFLLIRGTLVRFRYDKLMVMAWSVVLPMTILYFYFFFLLKLMFNFGF
uniref:NADH-ubiquinone oxidoreductase chain 1 n=1 Tax=Carios vespertilionis TaxID=870211 RepID=A0A8B0R722_9ACAR|nr:NADH dehydrogenase subunit 1 [Carios vespertilionis]QTW91423.1 NADH dehydrogenase subunit 1 [Carios vespertilionis]QTW91436.1 NADH dehydrogenase subunit 1 [Carios vespertilionis]